MIVRTGSVFLSCACSNLTVFPSGTRQLVDVLWSPAGTGLTSWLSFVISNCDVVTFSLVVPRRCFFGGSFMLFLSCFVMLSCTSVC